MEENVKLPNMRIGYSLENEKFIYISKIIALTLCDVVSITVYMLMLGFVFHVDFGENVLVIFITYLILGFFFTCLGTFLCILLKDESTCNNILGVIQLVLCTLGGVFFPDTYLGKIGIMLSNLSIVKWINYGLGNYVYGFSLSSLMCVCGIALICSLILLLITRKLFKIQLFIK
ncbi:ABC transporter permease [Sedimentibacter sp. zth1]|uniref:ABC transporter permease n=1 Tax=Sedimentibacter sp. zth1 TaxID=2816908 RepID=UPI001F5F8859|nr:ABC transporter permease [Sedimentibacter sp. zth1]